MTNNNIIGGAKEIKIIDQTYIDGRNFRLTLPLNIADCAAQECYGRVVTNLGKNEAGLYFFKNVYDEIIAVDIEQIDLIKVYKVKVAA